MDTETKVQQESDLYATLKKSKLLGLLQATPEEEKLLGLDVQALRKRTREGFYNHLLKTITDAADKGESSISINLRQYEYLKKAQAYGYFTGFQLGDGLNRHFVSW